MLCPEQRAPEAYFAKHSSLQNGNFVWEWLAIKVSISKFKDLTCMSFVHLRAKEEKKGLAGRSSWKTKGP